MSLLQALDDERREVLQELEEQKKKKQKDQQQDETQPKDDSRPDNKPKGAMSAVYGNAQLPNPLARASARRNSTPNLSGGRQPQLSSLRRRPASPGSSLLSPTFPNPLKSTRRRSDISFGSSDSLSDKGARLREDADNGSNLEASAVEDSKLEQDEFDVDGEEHTRGRGRKRSTNSSTGSYESESRSPSLHANNSNGTQHALCESPSADFV